MIRSLHHKLQIPAQVLIQQARRERHEHRDEPVQVQVNSALDHVDVKPEQSVVARRFSDAALHL
jgi:hypothetical protein